MGFFIIWVSLRDFVWCKSTWRESGISFLFLRNSSGKVTLRESLPSPGVSLLLCNISDKRENLPEQQRPLPRESVENLPETLLHTIIFSFTYILDITVNKIIEEKLVLPASLVWQEKLQGFILVSGNFIWTISPKIIFCEEGMAASYIWAPRYTYPDTAWETGCRVIQEVTALSSHPPLNPCAVRSSLDFKSPPPQCLQRNKM